MIYGIYVLQKAKIKVLIHRKMYEIIFTIA